MGTYKTWYGYRDNLPKKAKYGLGERIDARFIQVLELLQVATYQGIKEKLPTLDRSLSSLDMLKFLLRIAWELRVLDDKKFETISERLNEAGRQIGGWRKGLQTKTSANK